MIATIVPIRTEDGTQYLVNVNGHTVYKTKQGFLSEALAWCFAHGVMVLT